MKAFFITATGTDIGKTFVTTGLISHLRGEGAKVSAIKPVASGFDPATAERSDPGVLLNALGEPVTATALDRIAPWRFAAPLSPDMASARERRSIDFESLIAFCKKSRAAAQDVFFVEGVGGAMVPLDARHTVLDWMSALDLPAILVAGTYLGTISHTLTAHAVLSARGISVRALVLNETGDGAVPIAETRATLGRFLPGVPIATLPRVDSPRDADAHFATLWRTIA